MKLGTTHDHKSIADAKLESGSSSSFGYMTSQIFPLEGNESSNWTIYPQKTGLTLKIVQNRSYRPKVDPCQFQQFQAQEFFHFVNFWDVSMRKEQQQPLWLINFAKIWSERVLRIKTKSQSLGIE